VLDKAVKSHARTAGATHPRTVRSGDCVALHRADDRAVAGDNIFPLLWTIRLSFTNFRANRPNATVAGVGIDNYVSVLTDPDVWAAMQATAHFLFWTILLQTMLGFTLAYFDRPAFRGHGFWTTVILIPMMLSPAVVGNFWAFLYQPQIGCSTTSFRSLPAFRRRRRDDRLGQAAANVSAVDLRGFV